MEDWTAQQRLCDLLDDRPVFGNEFTRSTAALSEEMSAYAC